MSLVTTLAACYRWAAIARSAAYRRGWLSSRQLGRPVISVGNLTTGGTGKTPLVALIARLLEQRGLQPAILTRGYKRRRGGLVLAAAHGNAAARRRAGDEPSLLAGRLPNVPVVVCANRYRAGRYAAKRFNPGAFILDDGFQRLKLRRNVDIVALDATREISDRLVLPAGRQREPVAALQRANIIVITRTELADAAALEKLARLANPAARIFHARTRLSELLAIRRGSSVPPEALRGKRAFAFCGIGNPNSFFSDLERWGILVADMRAFPDHHVYGFRELDDLVRKARAARADALVMTEKDVMNLPEGWAPPIDAFACVIDAELVEAAEFEAALLGFL